MIIHALSNLKWMDEAHLCSKQTKNKQTNTENMDRQNDPRVSKTIFCFFYFEVT